jgi:uncharacterized protein (DUF58 family)
MSFSTRYLEPAMVERLNHLQLSARRVVEGTTSGLHKSPFKGASIEFRQHRFYVPGDDRRRLDWRVLGRTDRHYIKEYDEETNLRCALMLDVSGSMAYAGDGRRSKFEYAAQLVCALSYLMLANTEHVGLALFSQRLDKWIGPRSGQNQLSQIVGAVENAVPSGAGNPAAAMHELADRLGRRSLVIVVSDFLAPVNSIRQGLAHFGHDRHEVIVLRVLDPDETDFPFKTWSHFHGLEGEKSQRCEPAVMRKIYLENFRRHAQQLQDRCRSSKAEFATFLTSVPLLESVTRFLRHRGPAALHNEENE